VAAVVAEEQHFKTAGFPGGRDDGTMDGKEQKQAAAGYHGFLGCGSDQLGGRQIRRCPQVFCKSRKNGGLRR
jgi:hypothetical protein